MEENIQNNLEEEIEEEEEELDHNALFNISSWGIDLSWRELILMYKDNELVKPELQRHYVWKKKEASRFIESILLGLPIPSIFLANTEDNQKLIIDGYQRIMSVYDYVEREKFGNEETIFKLTNSPAIHERWRGKSFKELDIADQRKIKSTSVHGIIFEQKYPKNDDSLYQIFERINTGGQKLLSQEIRHCVYHGRFNDFLIDLNNSQIWREMYGTQEVDQRMQDIELILRYFTIRQETILYSDKQKITMKQELNRYMEMGNNFDSNELQKMKEDFLKCLEWIKKVFGQYAFVNTRKTTPMTKKINRTIFESLMIATSLYLKDGDLEPTDAKNKLHALLSNNDFQNLISIRTTHCKSIRKKVKYILVHVYEVQNCKISETK